MRILSKKVMRMRGLSPLRRRVRGPNRFTQADLTRVIRAAQKAELEIAVIRIEPDGSILIVPGSPESVASLEANEWDE